ncbi:MAG: hypothetical protein IPL35_07665 [Sphingobacteriales bacterium]|nr:hypothetical protein [Sphingobacteriales bacterium]
MSIDLADINTDTLLKMSIANDTRINELIKDKKQLFGTPTIEVIRYSDNEDCYFVLNADE